MTNKVLGVFLIVQSLAAVIAEAIAQIAIAL